MCRRLIFTVVATLVALAVAWVLPLALLAYTNHRTERERPHA